MLTLQNKLYESLLDDEETLIGRSDDAVANDLLTSLFGEYSVFGKVLSNGKISYKGILTSSSKSMEELKKIFSGKYTTNFGTLTQVEIPHSDFIYNALGKDTIYIDKIEYLYLHSSALNNVKFNDLSIGEVEDLSISVDTIDNSWQDIFRQTKINNMFIGKGLVKSDIDEQIKNTFALKGLAINKLIIKSNLVPGYKSGFFFNNTDTDKVNEFLRTILNNNKIKSLYIADAAETSRTKFYNMTYKVKKIQKNLL